LKTLLDIKKAKLVKKEEKHKKIKIEINNKEYNVYPFQTVIEVADNIGIYIPRFCYHHKLSISANCRM
jgi:NADH-quinone oxidoreductase subunit G